MKTKCLSNSPELGLFVATAAHFSHSPTCSTSATALSGQHLPQPANVFYFHCVPISPLMLPLLLRAAFSFLSQSCRISLWDIMAAGPQNSNLMNGAFNDSPLQTLQLFLSQEMERINLYLLTLQERNMNSYSHFFYSLFQCIGKTCSIFLYSMTLASHFLIN